MNSVLQDIRYGARQLRLNPGFAAVAAVSLALGIGANTAIFQLVDAVRLRTLPVERPQELAYIDWAKGSTRNGNFSTRSARLTSSQWDQIRSYDQPFSGYVAWSAGRLNLVTGGEPRYAESIYVNADFFRVLGVQPILGRTFSTDDDRPDCPSAGAVISYAFWQREFGGDAGALARTVTLEGRTFPILGVTPPSFFGVEVGTRYDVAIPLCADRLLRTNNGTARADIRNNWWLSAMGRLKPGWTLERANAFYQTVSPAITKATLPPSYRPDQAKRYLANKLAITQGATGVSQLRRTYENPLWILLATTALVLLIACANLANLLLARASVREREIAVRQAIGASRGRIVAQLLAESGLLALLGTALGALVAEVLSRGLIAFLSRPDDATFLGLGADWRVLGFTAGIGISACLLFGLMPALRATRTSPAAAMRAGGRGLTSGRERFTLRRALVISQVALSLVLLFGALLFSRSLRNLLMADTGFRADGLMWIEFDLRHAHYTTEQIGPVTDSLLDRLRAIPGVTSAAIVNIPPVSGSSWNDRVYTDSTNGPHENSLMNSVGPQYFKTTGTAVIAGREFDSRDTLALPKVAIVNRTFAKRFFGAANPIGRVFHVDGEAGKVDQSYQVVGLIADTKYNDLHEDFQPIAFLPIGLDSNPTFMLRAGVPPAGLIRQIKTDVAAFHPSIGIEFHILTKQLNESLLRDRLMATLAGAFGFLAALLATLGLYGVIAYMVARRRNEIGVRIALGAGRTDVVRLILREAALLLIVGIVVGAAASLWAGQATASLLFGLKPRDPATLAASIALLAAVALVASYIPARRASRLQPMTALREE
jgi:predicted permease